MHPPALGSNGSFLPQPVDRQWTGEVMMISTSQMCRFHAGVGFPRGRGGGEAAASFLLLRRRARQII